MNRDISPFLKEIKSNEAKNWRSLRESSAVNIIESFINSKMEMAEVRLDILPQPEQRKDSKIKSTKLDSFASSFYAWKKKKSTKQKLTQLKIEIILIRRGNKIALKKRNQPQKTTKPRLQ